MPLYCLPVEKNQNQRGPKYIAWRYDPDPPGIVCSWLAMYYGFVDFCLLLSQNISPQDDAGLRSNADVYAWPTDLTARITDGAVVASFFESVNIPTDWTTPSTTYLEFLRSMAGIFQFNQRYGGLSGGQTLLGNGVTLETNWNSLTAGQQSLFNQTIASFGYNFIVNGNPKLRSLAKQAGDLWGSQPFFMGSFQF